jgi:hypothetical protein
MPELNLNHIDQITRDVRLQEIGFSHLFHDLVDHICCDIEYQMQQGLPFDDAYRNVKAKIGFRGLKQIQEDTLYAVDNKYRNMKKLMKISGVTGTIMLGFAAIFKIMHWPLAGVLLSLGALVVSFLFLPSAFSVLWKETKNQKKLILFISAFFAGVAFILGMLFKIQHWPGAGYIITFSMIIGIFLFIPSLLYQLFLDKDKKHKRLLYIIGAISVVLYCTGFWFRIMHWPLASISVVTGSFVFVFIFLPLFTRMQWKTDTHVNPRFIFMVIAALLFIVPGALVNLNLERNYEGGFYQRLGKQEALLELQRAHNKLILVHFTDSAAFHNMDSIHSATEKLLGTISQIQHNMVVISEGPAGTPDKSLLELSDSGVNTHIVHTNIKKPFLPSPTALMLIPGCQPRIILEKEISGYEALLTDLLGAEWTKVHSPQLNPSGYLPGTLNNYRSLTLATSINGLSVLSSGILLTEADALNHLSSKN